MDNLIRIENCKDRIADLDACFPLAGEDERFELKEEIKILEWEIARLEQEDEDGDDIILSVR